MWTAMNPNRTSASAWTVLAFTHRWLGIAGCLLFLVWFVSGIAMMYVRMPELAHEERVTHQPPIAVESIRVAPADADPTGRPDTTAIDISMLDGRPIYRFGARTPLVVFADSGEPLREVTTDLATRSARAFAGAASDTVRWRGRIERPDQWTLQLRQHLPMHHFVVDDEAGTELYVSGTTGTVVLDTSRRERAWAYVGPVAHWLYLPVLRRDGPLWTQVIIWSSAIGCVLCLTGLAAGLLRLSPRRRYAIRGERMCSPYTGWMKWHHYAGLLFGVVTLTWTFSGLLSMGPFPLLSSEGITADQRRAVTGTPPPLSAISVADVRRALEESPEGRRAREAQLVLFRGRAYWKLVDDPSRTWLVVAKDSAADQRHVFDAFDRGAIEAVARAVAPKDVAAELTWIDRYDEYYYDRSGRRALPVLRARYADASGTWLYFDPAAGGIALALRRPDRLNRWLYHGLHSLDPAWLRNRRPTWDATVILLSLGGLAGVVSSLVPAWRRLTRPLRGRRSNSTRRDRP